MINSQQQQGAQSVVIGCTKIFILKKKGDVAIPVFDTTLIHVQAALAFALQWQELKLHLT